MVDAAGPDATDQCGTADTMIGDKPPAFTNSTAAAFTFTSTPAGCSFQCRLGSQPFMPCAATFNTTAALGSNTIEVKAGGDTTPATYTWFVDNTAPNTTVTCPPDGPNEVSIAFASTEANSTFRCIFDNGAEADCTSPFRRSDLATGSHTFSVVAVDRAGNRDATAASCSFNVTTAVPNTNANCPAAFIDEDNTSITFTSSVSGSTFTCQVGDNEPEPCTSPLELTGLEDGEVVVVIVATANGQTEQDGATCEFTVDTVAPTCTISNPQDGAIVPTTQAFSYTCDDPTAAITCSFLGNSVDCTRTSFTATNIPGGEAVFTVTATDEAGNTGSDSVNVIVNATGPAVAITFAPVDGAVVPDEGSINFTMIDPTFTNTTCSCEITLGASTTTMSPCTSPIPWSGLQHNDPVSARITCTDNVTGTVGPTASKSALVDAAGPLVTIISPTDSVVGPIVTFEFTFAGSDPQDVGPFTWVCTGPQGVFTCEPNVPIQLDPLNDGFYSFEVVGTDPFGNTGSATQNFEVDATGPFVNVTGQPDGEACPSTSDLGDRITFELSTSGDPPNGGEPVEENDPVRFECSLDQGPLEDCDLGNNQGQFEWNTLADGPHELVIVAYDRFDNPGPENPETVFGVGRVVDFIVDRDPPEIFEISIDNAVDVDGTFVTSGDSDINTGEQYRIRVRSGDLAHSPAEITSITINGVECSTDPENPTPPCTLDEVFDQTGEDGTTVWFYTFSGLTDVNPEHTVTVTVEDQCGPINEVTDSFDWLVDSTAPALDFNDWNQPFTNTGGVANDPQNDTTGAANSLNFLFFDPSSTGMLHVAEEPFAVTCAIGGVTHTGPACDRSGSPTTPAVTINYSEPFTAASEGQHTANVSAVDKVGNTTPGTVVWCVDTTPPDIEFPALPEGTCTTNEGGTEVKLTSGIVDFNVSDQGPGDPCAPAGLESVTCTLEAFNGETYTPVTGYVDVDCSASSQFLYGTNAGMDPLVDGFYRLTVEAVDLIGSGTTTETYDFYADDTPPAITFVSPMAASDPDAIFANIIPVEQTEGTFTPGDDIADQAPTFDCTLNSGTAEACADGSYLAPSTEGEHDVSITSEDCIGNTNTQALGFFVDVSAPAFSATPNCATSSNCTVDNEAATVTFTFNVSDAITNIDSARCLLDYNDDNTNPDIDDGVRPTVDCVLTPAINPSPATTVPRPRTYTGTATFSELAPGTHKLWVEFEDNWGHISSVVELEFEVNRPDGHVVAIGHDFVDDGGCEGTGCTSDPEKVLGNSVYLTNSRGFARPIRVAFFNAGAADEPLPDGGLDGTATDNVQDAIARRLAQRGESGYDFVEFGNAALLDAYMLGRDVLVVYDQNDSGTSTTLGNSGAWRESLLDLANAGAVIIVLDGTSSNGALSQTIRVLGGSSPEALIASNASFLDDEIVSLDCRNDHPIADDVDPFSEGEPSYFSISNTVTFDADPTANQIFSGNSCEFDAAKPFHGDDENCVHKPVVTTKIFPVREDSGPITVTGFRDEFDEGGPDTERRDSNSFAVFNDPDGTYLHHCRLREDGTAAYDVANGTTVSILSSDGDFSEFVRRVDSVYNVQRFDAVAVGRSIPLYDRFFVNNAFGEAPVCVTPFCAAADPDQYYFTIGCTSDIGNDDGPSVFFGFNEDEIDERCLFDSDGQESFRVLAEARDANGKTLAWALSEDIPLDCGDGCNIDIDEEDWRILAGDTPWVEVTDAYDKNVVLSGGSPASFDEEVRILLGFASDVPGPGNDILLYDEGYDENLSDVYWNLQATGGVSLADYRVHAEQWYGNTPTIIHTQYLWDAPTPPGVIAPIVVNRSEFLERVEDIGIQNGNELAWGIVGPGSPVAAADAGYGRILFDSTCGDSVGGIWTVVFPPSSAEQLTLIELPPSSEGDLDCYQPSGTMVADTVAFYEASNLSRDELRRDFWDHVYLVLGTLQGQTPEVETRVSANCQNVDQDFFEENDLRYTTRICAAAPGPDVVIPPVP